MIERSLIALALLLVPGSAMADSSLEGTWRSDADLTIRSIETVRHLTDEEREEFEAMLGHMTMSFGPDAVTVDWGEPGTKVLTVPFEVLERGADHVTVEFDDRQGGATETVKYHIEGDCIKRRVFPEGWFEYFCRLNG